MVSMCDGQKTHGARQSGRGGETDAERGDSILGTGSWREITTSRRNSAHPCTECHPHEEILAAAAAETETCIKENPPLCSAAHHRAGRLRRSHRERTFVTRFRCGPRKTRRGESHGTRKRVDSAQNSERAFYTCTDENWRKTLARATRAFGKASLISEKVKVDLTCRCETCKKSWKNIICFIYFLYFCGKVAVKIVREKIFEK